MLRMLCLQDPNTPIEESVQAMKVCSTLCPTQALLLCWVASLRSWPSTDLIMETAKVLMSNNARPLQELVEEGKIRHIGLSEVSQLAVVPYWPSGLEC